MQSCGKDFIQVTMAAVGPRYCRGKTNDWSMQHLSDQQYADIEGGKHLRPSQACSFRAATESSSQGFYIILFYSF